MLVLLLVIFVSFCMGSTIVQLNETNYVEKVSADSTPWLILFRSDGYWDGEVMKAVKKVAGMVEESHAHFGVVDCNQGTFCKHAFAMKTTPWLILFHSGVWSVGTTWVRTRDWRSDDELDLQMMKRFVMGEYRLKAKEMNPFRLRYDPRNQVSKWVWSMAPVFSFIQLGELLELRKNAAAVLIVGSIIVGFIVQRIVAYTLWLCCCRRGTK